MALGLAAFQLYQENAALRELLPNAGLLDFSDEDSYHTIDVEIDMTS